jgi:hypothetical protein|nr:MAG TPA: hypothetical protein [Caudoviricetes sp.]
MTIIRFDAETREAFRKIAELVDILGIKPIEELSNTEIVDKDGVVHDLSELIKTKWVINTGVCLHMAVHTAYEDLFISSGGNQFTPKRLAELIHEHSEDPDVEITVHKF